MAIPDYQPLMLPLLKISGDGETHQFRATVEALAQQFALTETEWRRSPEETANAEQYHCTSTPTELRR
ncbi:MAG TPA: winged helix-turn-helix domain-containing protein [Pyrinomonadaceae bacterium]|nr:winged helix-turn-helix domain-containing protein [Pyrinomonadaceae bacterium]